MDQRPNTLRQTVATREAATDTLSTVQASAGEAVAQAKQFFDVNQQVQERPWTMLGASVVAGYLLGSLLGDDEPSSRYYQEPPTRYEPQNKSSKPGMLSDVMEQFRDELDLLKTAAVTTVTTLLQDTLKTNVPQFAEEFERARKERDEGEQIQTTAGQSTESFERA